MNSSNNQGVFSLGSINLLVKIGNAILPYAIKMDGRGRTGGFLTIINKYGAVVAVILFGEVKDLEKANEFRHNSTKKSLRLVLHSEHVSGFQSMNAAIKDYYGSIRDRYGNIYGFSGFNQETDEAFSAACAFGIDKESMPQSLQDQIAEISSNPHLWELCEIAGNFDYFSGRI